MTPLPAIPADLVTPLGAYLRLRGERGGSFLLESVERGRLGRNSFVGWGSRVVSFEEAETLGAPVVGYLAYDYASTLEPTVPLPADGPALPESRFVVVETLVRFDHGAVSPRCWSGCRRHRGAARASARDPRARGVSGAGRARALPDAGPVRGDGAPVPDAHRGGRRLPDRAVAARDARTPAEPLELYRALRRVNPSPYLFLLELDELALVGSSPERLVACEDGRANVSPIAGTTAAGEGDVERLLASEKDRAEHVMLVDLGRNDLARVPRRHRARGAVAGDRALLPSRISCPRSSASCATA